MLAAVAAGQTKLGKPLALKETTAIDKLVANPDAYVGKTVQVKGTVREVCQKAGCWMEIADESSGKAIRIKVKEGEIVFPKDAPGKTTIAEGKLVKIEMTKEEAVAAALHEARENNRKVDVSSITSGRTVYQIQGTGAVIL
jgi:hypothetical protein